jgi:DNA polymerase V
MQRKIIPLDARAGCRHDGLRGAEPFALMVLGDSMLPEFAEGEIIVVEPEGLAATAAMSSPPRRRARSCANWSSRAGGWWLHPLNPRYPDAELAGIEAVRGVVIQKSRPGARRSRKSYVD